MTPTDAAGATTSIGASRLWTGERWVEPAVVELEAGRVRRIRRTRGAVPDRVLAPGFVDLQVNGVDDIDVNDHELTPAAWARLDALLRAQGTTAWCPTLVTASLPALDRRIAAIGAAAATWPAIVGVHLEGPFLGRLAGAHDPALVRAIDLDWLARLPPLVRIVTLGAEQADAVAATRLLAAAGVVVAIGHSDADAATAAAVVDAGARLVTHLYNAMSPLRHRAPGVVGVALADDRVVPSVIADGVHVDPLALQVAFAAKAATAECVLVTDAVAWRAGRLASRGLTVGEDGVPRLADGTLAGSALTMDAAVRLVVERCGVDLGRALRAASTVPARLLGLADRGTLTPGARADLVALDAALRVEPLPSSGPAAGQSLGRTSRPKREMFS